MVNTEFCVSGQRICRKPHHDNFLSGDGVMHCAVTTKVGVCNFYTCALRHLNLWLQLFHFEKIKYTFGIRIQLLNIPNKILHVVLVFSWMVADTVVAKQNFLQGLRFYAVTSLHSFNTNCHGPTASPSAGSETWWCRRSRSVRRSLIWTTCRGCQPKRILLGAFAKLRKATISSIMSVRPSAWNNSAPTGRILMKLDI